MYSFSRRNFLGGAGNVLSSIGVAETLRADERPANPSTHKFKVIVAGGHPGDPEYGCGGTIAQYTLQGSDVVLLYLNRGQGGISGKSGDEAAAIRTAEAKIACRVLNARPLFGGQIDGASVVDGAHYHSFWEIIRAENPDVLFTHWPIDNHPDHRATSSLCYEAWLRMDKRFGFYYYEVSSGEDTIMFSPTDYVDVAAVERQKREACFAHKSQSPDRFYTLQNQVARFRGIESGFHSAEAFVRHVHSRGDLLPHAHP